MLSSYTTAAKVTIIFDLPIARPAKTTLFANFETKLLILKVGEGKRV